MQTRPRFQYLLIILALLCASTSLWAQSGSLDPTFGNKGIVTTPGTIGGVALVIQTDGKFVVAGGFPITGTSTTGLAVARYNPNGSLDSAFGRGGVVTSSSKAAAFAVALQQDQKILVAVPGPRFNISVIRLNTNGSVDTAFGSSGIATFNQFGRVFQPVSGSLVVQPDGNLLLAVGGILRILPDGQVDTTFGKGGVASVIEGTSLISLLPNGQILAASVFTFSAGIVARYNSDGSLDRTFGVNGQAAGLGGVSAILPLSSGKFILAGTLNATVAPLGGVITQGFSLVRYNANGTIDNTFGNHGGVITTFSGDAFSAAASLVLQTNGDVVAAGTAQVGNPAFGLSQGSFALARYLSNGPLDTTFGTGGRVTTAFGTQEAAIVAIAIQSDGKIVALGNEVPSTFGTPNNGFTLARYLP